MNHIVTGEILSRMTQMIGKIVLGTSISCTLKDELWKVVQSRHCAVITR